MHSTIKYLGGHSDVVVGAVVVKDTANTAELTFNSSTRRSARRSTRGLPAHPGHEFAKAQMRDFGGMVSFRVAAGERAAAEVCDRTRLFTLGESLGGVESLIEQPARMTHASASGSPLEVPADLIGCPSASRTPVT